MLTIKISRQYKSYGPTLLDTDILSPLDGSRDLNVRPCCPMHFFPLVIQIKGKHIL